MKSKLPRILTLLFVFLAQLSYGQMQTMTGTVTNEDGMPLPGVNVLIKGTSTGTQTDFDGNYTIDANRGDILVFSFVGLETAEYAVGEATNIDVVMSPDSAQLDEVIVTAQGIRREKKALGYSVSTVTSEDLEQKADTDIGKILRGKASGVRITGTGGVSGSGSNIIIRGLSSISGGNQPLFIVDGVPFDGSSSSANQSANSGSFQSGNVSSRFADLDPNNIASVSILKGLSATALYGGDGRNGVILITTKTGQNVAEKLEISVNQSVFMNDIILPDYQDEWGGGFQNVYGPFFSNWGSGFDTQETIPNAFRTMLLNNFGVEPSTLFPDRPDLDAETVEYRPYDSQEDFFRTGIISSTSITANGSFKDKGYYNASYSYTDDKSFIPENGLRRNNFSVGGSYNFDNRFTVSAKMNYARTEITSPFTDASTGSDVTISTAGTGGVASIWNILYVPRSVDINDPYQHPVTGESLWYRGGNDRMNPRWALYNTRDTDDTDRIFGNFNVTYDIADWVDLTYRVGVDNQNRNTSRAINKGANDGIHPNGYLQTVSSRFTIWDHTVMAMIDKEFGESFELQANVGTTLKGQEFSSNGVESRNQIVFGLQNHGNFINSSSLIEGTTSFSNGLPYQDYYVDNNQAVFATATFGYDSFLYLNATARNEWSSTLEEDNRSQFSPGISLSFLPTAAFDGLRSDALNYLKFRGSYGTAPGFPRPYNTRNVLALNPQAFVTATGNVISTSVSNVLANPDLKPELSKEWEVGMEGRFFNNRLNFEVTYYNRETEDQIFTRSLPPESGFLFTTENVGNVKNEGIEITFNASPFDGEKFSWNIGGQFTQNDSEVEGIIGDQFLYGGLFSTPQNAAINGEQLGVIFGSRVARDENGNKLVDENGFWIQDSEDGIIGDPNPDWFATLTNGFRIGNFSLDMQWEYQQGGDIYATTIGALIGRGVVKASDDQDPTQSVILPGIRETTGEPNDIQITMTEAYFNQIGFGLDEQLIYDATHIRLREASLGFNMPKKLLEDTPFGTMNFSLVGQNLFVKAFNTPDDVNYDPELNSLGVGNSQGFDYLTSWNSRRYGLSVKLTF
ncbi:SusC/RagA family TonB-linked outer membrane protein [Gramella sp. BOM4]|nr:SusC/RagA family TonB-linked outer membrane protein [Christiangramia bathymodioli]